MTINLEALFRGGRAGVNGPLVGGTRAVDDARTMGHGTRVASDFALSGAVSADFDAVVRLLTDNHLPVGDLEQQLRNFTLAKQGGGVIGTVGLELYGEEGLLRSLCVASPHRCGGIGAALVAAAISRAKNHGVRTLYLLTTGAARYFAAIGFTVVAREQVPDSIRGTSQFGSLCPSSAMCLSKTIEPSLEVAASDR